MNIKIEITEEELKALVIREFQGKIGASFKKEKVHIQTKSKQNYKSEWETAAFKATYEGEI